MNKHTQTIEEGGVLYIVATPIGNMQDITVRAIDILTTVDVICAEDTRVAGKLLKNLEIPHKKLVSVNEFADAGKIQHVIDLLEQGQKIAFISDAGTPGISDPGALLASSVREKDIKIIPIGGISAVTTALSVAGIRETPFLFYGFLPHKKGRQKILDSLLAISDVSLIFYESPHRFIKLLEELIERENESIQLSVTVCRELTKIYEDIRQGSPSDLLAYYEAHKDTIRGEFVLIVRKKSV
ncbi:MAG: 16S rRNA (cytidine(1402)-2'-O)-methyltransferase [Patescibacteria group bacterium]